jgi:hypothetical protein
MNPQTVSEWVGYIGTLSGPDLLSKAMAANSLAFVQLLQEEGMPPSDITAILLAWGRRIEADGQALPEGFWGEYLSYGDLLEYSLLRAAE